MKSIYTLLFLSIFSLSLFGQTPLTEAVDFTAKDVDGQQQHLFDILASDKYVLIDFFSVTCGPCQDLAPKVDTVYHYFGNNESELYVMGVDQTFNNEDVQGFQEEYHATYPSISGTDGGGAAIYESYQIPYYPSMILIAPNGNIVEQAIENIQTAQELIDLLESYDLNPSSIDESVNSGQFDIFPNPVMEQLTIQTASSERIVAIKIFSLTGQEVFGRNTTQASSNLQLNLSNLNKGVYLLSVEYSSGDRYSRTFIKK